MATKAQQIANHLNTFCAERPFNFRQIAEAKAADLNVWLYWYGTAEPERSKPTFEVWMIGKTGRRTRKLGEVVRNHEGVWRA